jgi:NinB protein
MNRALIIIHGFADREHACRLIRQVAFGTRVEFKAAKRTLPQNDRMWAMLTDVSRQIGWHGQRLKPNQWKLVFLDALKRELRLVPNIDGTGFVNLGVSSSDLTKDEMSQLMELIAAFGAERGVVFQDQEEEAAPADERETVPA